MRLNGREMKAVLLSMIILIAIGISLVITSWLPVLRGSYKAVYPISRLKEYASYGRGEYYASPDGYDNYVFHHASLFLNPGIYRLSFIIEAKNFSQSTPYVLFTASFDDMGANIGTTLDSASGKESRMVYAYDKFESKQTRVNEPAVPATIILVLRFLPQEQGGVVTIYFNTEPYEIQLGQFFAGFISIIGGGVVIALRMLKQRRQSVSSKVPQAKGL